MKIRCKNWVGISLLVISVVGIVIQLLDISTGGKFRPVTAIPFLTAIFGYLYLVRPLWILENKNKIIVPALIGPAKRVFEFDSVEQLSMKKGKLFVTQDEKTKEIPVNRKWANADDWALFVNELNLSETA